MKRSMKTRLVMMCLLLVFVMIVGQIVAYVFVTQMPDFSQAISTKTQQKIWLTVMLLMGGSVLVCISCIFWVIIPQSTLPETNRKDISYEVGSGEALPMLESLEKNESQTQADNVNSLQKQIREHEDSLLKERSLLRTLIDTLPDLIYIKDTEHRFVVANTALVKHIGVETLDELLGKSDLELMPFKFATRYYEDERTVLEAGEPLLDRIEAAADCETGEKRWFLSTKVPFYDHQGKIEGLIGIGRDITRLEKEMEALQELVSDLSWENLFLSENRKAEE